MLVLSKFFNRNPSVPGALISPVDPRAAQFESLFPLAGQVTNDSRDWSDLMPPFKLQGPFPFCTTYQLRACFWALNKLEARAREISMINTFFEGGGSINGAFMENVAHVGIKYRRGYVYEADKPTPNSYVFGNILTDWPKIQAEALDIDEQAKVRASQNKIEGYAQVNMGNSLAIHAALEKSPLGIAVPIHENYLYADKWWKPRPNPVWHAVTLVKQLVDGSKLVFDSLGGGWGWDGFHWLPPDYPVGFGLVYTDLPDDWADKQNNWLEQQYPNAYKQYGKPRLPLAQEQSLAQRLRALVESYPDPGIRTIAGRFWVILVNAALYGGYSYTVKGPDGREYFAFRDNGSDLANALYHYRRTNTFPFNFDKLRSEQ